MLKKKQLPVVTELTVILSYSYVLCDMTISFLSILGKLPFHYLIETSQSLLTDTAMKSLNCQLKLMALVMIYVEIGARRNTLYLLYQINRHQHAESSRCWSYSGRYCDSNIKSEIETYATHLIFMQLPGTTWNYQELKAFHTKINRITH